MEWISCSHHLCAFNKALTIPVFYFELYIFIATGILYFLLSPIKNRIFQRYFILSVGVFIFEVFTAPMWHNAHLGKFGYLYGDVSWILNVGWTTLILSTILIVDHFFAHLAEWKRFILYVVILTVVVLCFEAIVIHLGIRTYSPEVQTIIAHKYIPIINVPLAGIYYIPVFLSLVIGFYKYWSLSLDNIPVVPLKKKKWMRKFFIAFISVFIFELMINPLVRNINFPKWSYIYQNISIILILEWIFILWIASIIVEKWFIQMNLINKLLLSILIGTCIYLPIESLLIVKGFRVYGPSATANFSGFYTPIGHIPIEIIFAVPFYLVLMISFIRYWEISLDNTILKQ